MRARVLSLCLLLTLTAMSGRGADMTVFGPQTFTRSTGKPVPVSSTFHITNPALGYRIRIVNHGVMSADVSVNDVAVFTPDDFLGRDKDGAILERAIAVRAGDNLLSVQLRSKPGTSLTAEIIAASVDATPPTITATVDPAPNTNGWNNSNVTVTFTCADSESGIATCPAPIIVSTEGAQQSVSGTAVDRAGNSQIATVSVSIDKTAPTITVGLTPFSGDWVKTEVTAHYLCSDAGSGIDVCPADEIITTEGSNQTVTGAAVDRAGNAASITSPPFNIDLRPPTIGATVNPPPNANGWNKGPVTIHFACDDATSSVRSCPSDQILSADGANRHVTGVAVDAAGNSATASLEVNIDSTPPAVTLTSPAHEAAVFVGTTTVSGVLSDPLSGISSVLCNGVSGTISGGTLACDVLLTPGLNSITATATDVAGNTSTASVSVRYVRVPQITLTSPINLSYLNITPTTITGTVDDPTATVTVNSIAAPVVNGAFSIALPLAEGPNTITATAVSAEGASGTASVTVTLDTTPPHVTITSPPDQFVTTEASISIAGSVNDIVVGTVNDQQAQVQVNGGGAQVANRTFLAASVPLALGANIIQAVAVDRVGNQATTEITVTRHAVTQPQITLVSGNNQTGTIGSLLSAPLVVALRDAAGNPIANTPVIFKVTQNDGMVAAAGVSAATVIATTDAQGHAQAQWTLGNRAGAGGDVVEAYAVGFEGTALFTATGRQGAAGKVVIDTGNDQVGAIEQPLPKPFIAVVVDGGNNRLAGVPVTFTVKQGGGSFDGNPALTVETDSDGRASATLTLGSQEGNANNVIEANFASSDALPAVFTASGRVPGDSAATVISGVVLDNSNQPVPGVTVRAVLTNVLHSNLASVQAAAAVPTNEQGQFSIPQAPVGFIKLLVDGSTAKLPGKYPSLEYDMVTVAGQNNTVGQPIYLLPLSTANQLCVTGSTGGGTLTIPEAPGFSLTFGPGQVTFPGGSKTGCISVTVVHGDKVPMVPGFGQQPRFIVTIQPSGAVFNPPAPITLPNVDGLKPREVTEMYSFDHDIGSFVAIGTGVVTDDGLLIRSSQGVGVLKAGWHCGGNPNTSGTAATCLECQSCQGTQCAADDSQTPTGQAQACTRLVCRGGAPATEPDSTQDGDTCTTPSGDGGQCESGICKPTGRVEITDPADNTKLNITAAPAMPQIEARAHIVGVTPDPTSTTSFDWTAELDFDATTCPSGIAARSYTVTRSASVVGGQYAPDIGMLRGGNLTLSAAATVSGQRSDDSTSGVQILGTNPARSDIQAALAHDTLRRIACQESRQRHFNAGPNGGTSVCPLFSSDGLGGAGVMQITNPAPSDDQVWNWRENVAAGIAIFNGKIPGARGFPAQVRASAGFGALVNNLNAARIQQGLPPLTVTLPDYTSGDFNANLQQLELDTVRGYNGYPGGGQFGLRMHEFRVQTDPTTGALIVDASGRASWVRVPVADRPSFGDPNYVNNILARDPRCGG